MRDGDSRFGSMYSFSWVVRASRRTRPSACAIYVIVVCALAASCTAVPPPDLSKVTYEAIDAKRLAAPMLSVSMAPTAELPNGYYAGSPATYGMRYEAQGVARRYTDAVCGAAFADAQCNLPSPNSVAELRLVSLSHVVFPHSVGTFPDVTDEVTAKWVLFDAAGKEVGRYVFVGTSTDQKRAGMMEAQVERAFARAAKAFNDLLHKTVDGFLAAAPLRRLAAVPPQN